MTSQVDPEQALLLAIQRELSPSPFDRQRVRSALALRIGAATSAAQLAASKPGDLGEARVLAPGLRGLSQQLVAAGLIGAACFGAGYLTGRSRPAPPTVSATTTTREVPPLEQVPAVEPLVAVPTASSLKATPSGRPVPASSPGPTVDAASTLSEEARELRRVDRALRAGSPLLALGILRELDEKVPRGALMEERSAARYVARCQSGDATAASAAAAWLEKHPRSVYSARVRASCNAQPASPSEETKQDEP